MDENGDAALFDALERAIPRYIQTIRAVCDGIGGEAALTLPQYRCRKLIGEQGVTLTTQLARRMQVTVPTMTSRLDGLVERGLVQRRPDPLSRRQIHVSLTAGGGAMLNRYRAAITARLGELLASLSAATRQRLLDALGDLDAALQGKAASEPVIVAARDG